MIEEKDFRREKLSEKYTTQKEIGQNRREKIKQQRKLIISLKVKILKEK